jgi:hypothetical protein
VVLLLCYANVMLGILLLAPVAAEARLPDWLFPVRGKWLRYLLTGAGILLLLPAYPLLCVVAASITPAFLGERVLDAIAD